jgi:Ni,Fe-hydrogenase I cytochrome b subunit
VLGETFKCCLRIDNRVEALRHGDLHRLGVVVLVWFVVFVVAHVQLLCRAQIVAQNGQESSVKTGSSLHLTGTRPPE